MYFCRLGCKRNTGADAARKNHTLPLHSTGLCAWRTCSDGSTRRSRILGSNQTRLSTGTTRRSHRVRPLQTPRSLPTTASRVVRSTTPPKSCHLCPFLPCNVAFCEGVRGKRSAVAHDAAPPGSSTPRADSAPSKDTGSSHSAPPHSAPPHPSTTNVLPELCKDNTVAVMQAALYCVVWWFNKDYGSNKAIIRALAERYNVRLLLQCPVPS